MVNSQLHWNYFTLLWNLVKVTCAGIFRIYRLLALINLLIVSIIVLKSNNVFFTLSENHIMIIIWLFKLAIDRCVICCLLLISNWTLLLILAWLTA